MSKRIIKRNTGYTIIETMIAVSLFVIIIMTGMGALLNANLLHQKGQNIRSIMDNLSFVMEDLSRNLRTGYNYRCVTFNSDLSSSNVGTAKSGQNCWGIAFECSDPSACRPSNPNDQWVYYISGGKLFKSIQGTYDTFPSNYVQLNPDEVVIDSISSFSVLGAEPPVNRQQPLVFIKLIGKITYKNVETPFSLQTSVSQRIIDI